MKKSLIFLFVMLATASLTFISCKKDNNSGGGQITDMPAETAKVEVRSAAQSVMSDAEAMMSTPAMTALEFLAELSGMDKSVKQNIKNVMLNQPTLGKINNELRKSFDFSLKKEDEPIESGIYTYNYTTNDFDLTSTGVNYVRFIFPADEAAFNAQNNNASFTMSNYQFTEFEYEYEEYDWNTGTYYTVTETEYVLTKATFELLINAANVMSANFQMTLNSDGVPTGFTGTFNMPPYQASASYAGAANSYTSTLSFSNAGNVLMSHNVTVTYTANQENVEKVSGHHQNTPIKLQGEIFPAAIDDYMENHQGPVDLTVLNQKIAVDVIQTVLNQKIGKLEFRIVTETYSWGTEDYLVMVVVYNDGTFDFIDDIMGQEALMAKAGKTRIK